MSAERDEPPEPTAIGIQWQERMYSSYDGAIRDAVERWRDGGWKMSQISHRFGGVVIVYGRPDVDRTPPEVTLADSGPAPDAEPPDADEGD